MYRIPDQDDDPSVEMMNKHTKRRKRRRANAVVRHGKSAVRAHQQKGGRTGMVQAKRTPGKRVEYKASQPNPPGPVNHNLGSA